MIVEFKTDNTWGDISDLDFRNQIREYINKVLDSTNNGFVDGGEIGSGIIRLFLYVVDAILATKTIVGDLKEKGVKKEFLIVHVSTWENAGYPIEYKVLYPYDFIEPYYLCESRVEKTINFYATKTPRH